MSNVNKLADAKPRLTVVPSTQWPEMRDGKPRNRSQANIIHLLDLEGVELRYNAFTLRDEISRNGTTADLSDADVRALYLAAHSRGLDAPKPFFEDVISHHARAKSYHPVREYLDGLKWDGEQRLDTWLTTFAGAEDTMLTRAIGAKILLAAVRRIRKPGCKFDQCLVLEGPQNAGKSSLVRILASEAHFTDCLHIGAEPKVIIEQTAGKWLAEMAELSGIRRVEVEPIKAMISRQEDRARLSYDKRAVAVPRQFVLFGTVNDQTYLRDTTGNRRFWPVKVGQMDLAGLEAARDQLWAEAAYRDDMAESIELSAELWSDAAAEQSKRMITDPWAEHLEPALDGKTGHVSIDDVWAFLGIKAERQDANIGHRLTGILHRLGFEKSRRRKSGKLVYCYSNNTTGTWFALGERPGTGGTLGTPLGTD